MNSLKQQDSAYRCRVITTGPRRSRSRSRFATARGALRVAILGTLFMIYGPLTAQETAPTMMAGTKLRVQFESEVGTAISRVDDGVDVRLLKAVESQGREAFPAGAVLSGRVLAVRKGDKRRRSYAMIRLGFSRITLRDGRSFPIDASLAELGASEYVDSEGVASIVPPSKGRDIGTAAASAGIGAGIGAFAGGAKGAGIGAGIGAGVDALGILAEHIAQWDDLTLKKGRKAWLRLNADFSKSAEADTAEASPMEATQQPQGAGKPPADEYPTKLPPSSLAPSADPSSLVAVQHSERTFALGAMRVTPISVDTGPLAAAEEFSYWNPKGLQFTIVTAQVEWAGGGPYCDAVTISLRTDADTEYYQAPLGQWGRTKRVITEPTTSWVFQINPGEHPARLLFRKPALHGSDCYGTAEANWARLGTDVVALPLDDLPLRDDIAEIRQPSTPVRFGQLEITLTAVGVASKEQSGLSFHPAQHSHHLVRLSLAIKNVSEHPNCTLLYSHLMRLFDSHGYEYEAWAFDNVPDSRIGQLLPGEGLGANISFEVWDGSAPRSLIIIRNGDWERHCTDEQHRPVDMHGGSRIQIPIEGVPEVSQPSS